MSASTSVPALSATADGRLDRRAWGALLVLCGALFLDALDVSMVGVALPSIRSELDMSTSSLQWVVSAYVLGYGGFLLLGGRAADLLGRRRVFLISLAVFMVASGLGALADDGNLLIATRFIKGMAAAFTAPAGLSIITTSFREGPARNRALAIYTATGATGFSLGLVIGGALTEIGWRWVFFLPVPVALVILLAAIRLVPDSGRTVRAGRSFDITGAVLVTAAMLLLVFTVVQAPSEGWGSLRTVASFAAVAALFAAFVAVERRSPSPLVRLGILRSQTLVRANLGAMSLFGAWVGFQFVATLYFQQVRGWSALETGLAIFPGGLLVALMAPRMAPLIGRYGTTRLITVGLSSSIVAYALFLPVGFDSDYLTAILPTMLLAGLGFALAFGPLNVAATTGIAAHEQGLAGGLLNSSFQFGGALALAVTTAVINAGAGLDASAQELLDAFGPALVVPVVVAVIGVAATALDLRREGSPAGGARLGPRSSAGRRGSRNRSRLDYGEGVAPRASPSPVTRRLASAFALVALAVGAAPALAEDAAPPGHLNVRALPGSPAAGEAWQVSSARLDAVAATRAHPVVALIDTGVRSGLAGLRGRVVAQRIVVSEPARPVRLEHGSAVALALAAGEVGACPVCRLVDIRVFGAWPGGRGGGGREVGASDPDVARAIDVARAYRPLPVVINLSLGRDAQHCSPDIAAAIRRALDDGIVVVAAAGNGTRQRRVTCPARIQGVLSVGALGRQDGGLERPAVGEAASWRIRPTLWAPGSEVLTELGTFSGSSLAAPIVAGVAAAVASDPKWRPRNRAGVARLIAHLRATGTPIDHTGRRMLDAAAALGNAEAGAWLTASAGHSALTVELVDPDEVYVCLPDSRPFLIDGLAARQRNGHVEIAAWDAGTGLLQPLLDGKQRSERFNGTRGTSILRLKAGGKGRATFALALSVEEGYRVERTFEACAAPVPPPA